MQENTAVQFYSPRNHRGPLIERIVTGRKCYGRKYGSRRYGCWESGNKFSVIERIATGRKSYGRKGCDGKFGD